MSVTHHDEDISSEVSMLGYPASPKLKKNYTSLVFPCSQSGPLAPLLPELTS